ncbi:hypothetical protein B0H14DRAFT_2690696 [Mycena olivaceomarginata]|nr:hypothetical protein B0H14DRAFT_2690696 [Mycena olivaceomarginata]
MYNRSISTVYIPGIFYEGMAPEEAFANTSRRDSFNLATLWTAEQQDVVRVPVMSYIRTVPRLKPLGAAITSVFVSTFAMVSVLWHVFLFHRGGHFLVAETETNSSASDDKEESLRATVKQMRRALDKHGLTVDDEESEDTSKFSHSRCRTSMHSTTSTVPWKTSHDEVALMRRYSRAHNKTYSAV